LHRHGLGGLSRGTGATEFGFVRKIRAKIELAARVAVYNLFLFNYFRRSMSFFQVEKSGFERYFGAVAFLRSVPGRAECSIALIVSWLGVVSRPFVFQVFENR
jgi:hypothetical protein